MTQFDSIPVNDVASHPAIDIDIEEVGGAPVSIDDAPGEPAWLADAIALLGWLTAAAPTVFAVGGAIGVLVGGAAMVHGGAALTVLGAVLVVASLAGAFIAVVVSLYVRVRVATLHRPATPPSAALPPPTGAARAASA
jgi:hypothetical protein